MGHGKGATYRAQARPPLWQHRRQPPARRRDPRCQAEHGSHGRRPRAAGRGSGGADHKRSCQLSARWRGPCGRPEGIWKSLSSLLTRHQHPPAGEPVQSARCGSRRDQPHQALVLPSPASPCALPPLLFRAAELFHVNSHVQENSHESARKVLGVMPAS